MVRREAGWLAGWLAPFCGEEGRKVGKVAGTTYVDEDGEEDEKVSKEDYDGPSGQLCHVAVAVADL